MWGFCPATRAHTILRFCSGVIGPRGSSPGPARPDCRGGVTGGSDIVLIPLQSDRVVFPKAWIDERRTRDETLAVTPRRHVT